MQKLLLVTFLVSLTCGILYFTKAKNGSKVDEKIIATQQAQAQKAANYDMDQDDSEESIYGQATEEDEEAEAED